jgi:hypothetical protein
MASKAKKAPAKKKANGYEQPKHIPTGTVLVDQSKNEWKIGKSIGCGGFGEIYSANKAQHALKNVEEYPYVVKIVSIFSSPGAFDCPLSLYCVLFIFRNRTGMVLCLLRCTFTCGTPNWRTVRAQSLAYAPQQSASP